ncbi:fimbrial biogenesis outer membrane usher protein [Arsenophonus nasoniae]|uniref:fimbria/pilus outer membrane usher protein n=1 Tax=Arsenophonus nasoniae TaxID=638 RepID=UPI000404B836|nr:fimbria/pilus outer membrane usher protein [Arsenophonus nasoniae]WGM12199.1 fimbrial biogenesis outer membrane usher protein [Arsenophonus nasoniae]WGM16879.1 fimbrial biogenesis outer membrane usher protein [Arsenophonus nasoniae]
MEAIEHDKKSSINLAYFLTDNNQLAGVYRVDIFINNKNVATQDITFINDEQGKLYPIVNSNLLNNWGIDENFIKQKIINQLAADTIIDFWQQNKLAISAEFDFNQQSLYLTFPQIALRKNQQILAWQSGVPAFFVNYRYQGANTWIKNSSDKQNHFMGLLIGANWQAWRLRHYGSYSSHYHWQNYRTTLSRDIHAIHSQLSLGENYTSSILFERFQFKGLQLQSDDSMLPDNAKGYAPIIQAIAETYATVTVLQNNIPIYQTYVPPGRFVINDLLPSYSNDRLKIIIDESNGKQRIIYQPYTTLPNMLRVGRFRYALNLGQYSPSTISAYKAKFIQFDYQYGLTNYLTHYGGIIIANNYYSNALGFGGNVGELGAVTFDAIYAKAKEVKKSYDGGYAYRFQYGKYFSTTNTQLTLAGYRYSQKDFLTFSQANKLKNSPFPHFYYAKKSQLQLNIRQHLASWGAIYLSAYQKNYWNYDDTEESYAVNYSSRIWDLDYTINYSYTKSRREQSADQILSINLQIPFKRWLKRTWGSYGIQNSFDQRLIQQINIHHSPFADESLFLTLQQNYERHYKNHTNAISGALYSQYRNQYTTFNLGYNHDPYQNQLNYGLQGSLVAHPYGLTLAQPIGETAALVIAKNAVGVKLENHSGIKTDYQGIAIIPNISSYRTNQIALATETLPDGVDIESNIQTVTPTRGAMATLTDKTTITTSGIVDDQQQLYLTGVPVQGEFLITAGNNHNNYCCTYALPHDAILAKVHKITAVCQ